MNPVSYEARGRIAYHIAGWPTPLMATSSELRLAELYERDTAALEPRIEVLNSVERQDFLWTYVVGELQADFSYLTTEAYTSVGPRVRLGLRLPLLGKYISTAVGWQLRVLEFRNLSSAISPESQDELGLESPYVLGFLDQRLFVDLRDNPVEPTRGVYFELRTEEGGKFALGAYNYILGVPDLRGYVPLPGKMVLAARLRVGAIFGDLPVTQRFFAGGASSQRGFPERRLAPTVSNTFTVQDPTPHEVTVGVPIGGGGIIETGAELRIPIGHWGLDWGFVAFLDGGDVTADYHDLDPTHLHWASGGGIRAATPIGAARLDVGYRLNRTGPGEPQAGDHWAFHFSLGEAF
jgi:outer membrane protein assembly factor BamA